MKPGDICKIVGLEKHPELNGKYCEVFTELTATPMLWENEIKSVPSYGCEVITKLCKPGEVGPVSGYFKPENLELQPGAQRRSIDLHLFGWTYDN